MNMHIVIIGATAAIAREIARRYAAQGASFVLVARDADRTTALAGDLQTRGAVASHVIQADLAEIGQHAGIVKECRDVLTSIDLVVIAHGVLPDQAQCDADVDAALATFHVNATSAISLTHRFTNVLEAQGSGSVVVLSSVAGERGRRSNYVYGSAKAALSAYASGLRAKAAQKGVHVITVKPGLVDTPMTAHLPKTALFATPGHVADAVVRAVTAQGRVIYAPWPWRPLMTVVRAIPERWFMRLKA